MKRNPSQNSTAHALVTQEQWVDFLSRTDEQEVDDTQLSGVDWPEAHLNDRGWKQCRLDHCRLPGSQLRNGSFTDVSFRGCDLSNCNFTDSVFSRVIFAECKLTGSVFFSCGLHDVQFQDSPMDYVLLTASKARTLRFTRCSLTESGLGELTGKSLAFTECDLRRADFRETLLSGVDLTTCDIAGASMSTRELRGAIVSSLQALELAALLGVVVRD